MESSIIIIIETIITAIVVIGAVTVWHFYVRKNKKLKLCHEFMRSQLELHEKNFDNIYREIHDNIGQSLSLAKLNLNTVETDPTSTATEKITYSKDLVGKAILDLRVLGKSLNTHFLSEIGLGEAIKRELFRSAKNGSYKMILEEVGHPSRLKDYEELIIFRIFLDLFNNSIHHLHAKKIIIHLGHEPAVFTLSISSEGRTFTATQLKSNPETAYPEFRNLQERAGLIGAELGVKSLAGKGSMVEMSIPVKKAVEVEDI
jgi:two-component system, NarL family, sensor kinase